MAKKNAKPRQPAAKAKRPAKKVQPASRLRNGVKPKYAVRIRMYRHGLGDCFLLTFPKKGGGEFRVLVDCGLIQQTPGQAELMEAVVADLLTTTKGRVDVLAVTHEHWDHVSGFSQEATAFKDFAIGAVWLAWTEDPHDAIARRLKREHTQRLKTLAAGLQAARMRLGETGQDDSILEPVAEVLGFFGVDLSPPPLGVQGASSAKQMTSDEVMKWLRNCGKCQPRFFRPGDMEQLEDIGVRVYVLGPPTDTTLLSKDLPTKAGHETYEENFAAAERTFFDAAFLKAGDEDDGHGVAFEGTMPFDRKCRIAWDDARGREFFRNYYFDDLNDNRDAWRRVDAEWVSGAAHLALKLDSDTNNTSLALAFELADGRVLLFPGDAQVGNWESWHVEGPDGKQREWKVGDRRVTAEALLNRTVLYKVGHHGSHNATLREKGLEMMDDPSLAAMLPVDVHIAHDKKRWKRMPFPPLIERLAERTQGRILQADQDKETLAETAGKKASNRKRLLDEFLVKVTDSKRTVRVEIANGVFADRPLYVEYELEPL